MAHSEFSISSAAQKIIREAGYTTYDSMNAQIQAWYSWYTSNVDDFYKVPYLVKRGNHQLRRSRKRYSLHPARRACREYASLIMTEDTQITAEAPKANAWLQTWLMSNNFWPNGQNLIERAFAIGTAAWVLDFDVALEDSKTQLRLQRYDARMIKPLSWDEEGVTECAVVTNAVYKGKQIERLCLYMIQDGTYHVKTHLIYKGREIDPEKYGYIPDFDTRSAYKPFGIVKPAIDNTVEDLSPYGMSIFADAMDAIKAVDLTFDSLFQEVELTGVKVFMDEDLIDVASENGKTIPLPKTDEQVFRMVDGLGAKKIDVFSPTIRTDALKQALNVALAEFGELCGFGQNYFTLDKSGGLKTATEVVADNGALMRNVKKHENAVRGAIQDVMAALIDNARIHCAASIEENFGVINVQFDDSVITDTQTNKNMALAEISILGVPALKRKYLQNYCGFTEDDAAAAVPDESAVVDLGF